jgi:rhomboid protease GluP
MDPNAVLPWIVGIASALATLRLLRLRSRAHRSWITVNALFVAAAAAGALSSSETWGYLVFGLWVLLILVPSLAGRAVQRCMLRQQFGPARRLAILISWLHPFGAWRGQPDVLRALEAAAKGDHAAAETILQRYRGKGTAAGRFASVHLFRLKGEWEPLLQWIKENGGESAIIRDPALLPAYLRALGETGELHRLSTAYRNARNHLSDELFASVRPACRLIVSAFLGRKDSVDRLLRGPLRAMPEGQQVFWRATADMAIGDVEPARNDLRQIRDRCDATTQIAIDRRLARPLANAATENQHELFDQLDRELSEEERFGHQHGRRGRPNVTYAFLAANIVGYAVEELAGDATDVRTLYHLGALSPLAVVKGEWWRIFLAQFLHFGALHLIMNMLGLLIFGPYLEFALGRLRYVAVYLLTGSAAMLLLVFLHMGDAPKTQQIVVGASGNLMGLIGATAGLMLIGWRREGAQLAKRRLASMVFILLLQTAFDFAMPQVSFTAHAGGAFVGLVVTLLLASSRAARNVRTPAPAAVRS